MSWLSDRTGIHIGLGPPKASTKLPANLQNADPATQAGYENMIGALNGKIAQQDAGNKTAAEIGGAAFTPVALGALGVGGAAAGAGAAGAAGGADAAGNAAGAGSDTTGGGSSGLPSWLSDILGGAGGVAGGVGSFLKDNSGSLLEGANVAEAALRQQQATNYAKQALQTAQDAYGAKAGLRSAGIAGMLNPSANAPNLSPLRSLAGAGSGNPFARGLPMAGAPTNNTPVPQQAIPTDGQPIANGPPPPSDTNPGTAIAPKLSFPMPGGSGGGVLGSLAGASNGQPASQPPGALPMAGAIGSVMGRLGGGTPSTGGVLGSIGNVIGGLQRPPAPLPLAPSAPAPTSVPMGSAVTPPMTPPGLRMAV